VEVTAEVEEVEEDDNAAAKNDATRGRRRLDVRGVLLLLLLLLLVKSPLPLQTLCTCCETQCFIKQARR
jgi:hypothetical protein